MTSMGFWGGARVCLLPPSLAYLAAPSSDLQWDMPGKGQVRTDEAPRVGGRTKGCSLVRKIVLPGSAFLPLSRHGGGGGSSVYIP